jgi:hypothetical protein
MGRHEAQPDRLGGVPAGREMTDTELDGVVGGLGTKMLMEWRGLGGRLTPRIGLFGYIRDHLWDRPHPAVAK